ncbi:hypothetical protein TNCV_12551 [Trichonephila clavipes]|nr:hypothetical protein TNCV_12551 [Trichonephila clavipes]
MNNSVPVTTPSCHVRSTNQDTLYQAGPTTSGHIYNLDMGWRNASRSVSQRRPALNVSRVAQYHLIQEPPQTHAFSASAEAKMGENKEYSSSEYANMPIKITTAQKYQSSGILWTLQSTFGDLSQHMLNILDATDQNH